MEAIRCRYYLRVTAQDRPGVLSKVAGILGDNDISIANVIQKGRGTREAVPVVMLTHEARERDMRAALAEIDRLRDVAAATTMIRVEGSRREGWRGVIEEYRDFLPGLGQDADRHPPTRATRRWCRRRRLAEATDPSIADLPEVRGLQPRPAPSRTAA